MTRTVLMMTDMAKDWHFLSNFWLWRTICCYTRSAAAHTQHSVIAMYATLQPSGASEMFALGTDTCVFYHFYTTLACRACGVGVSDDNAKVQAAAMNILNLALTVPGVPVSFPDALVGTILRKVCMCVLHLCPYNSHLCIVAYV